MINLGEHTSEVQASENYSSDHPIFEKSLILPATMYYDKKKCEYQEKEVY